MRQYDQGGVPHRVLGQPLLACLHELLGPSVVGVGLIPSRRHRLLTVASRRNPSSTMRIFSSAVYLRRVVVLTLRTKRLDSESIPQRPLPYLYLSGTSLLLSLGLSSPKELTPPQNLGFSIAQTCPIIADGLQGQGATPQVRAYIRS